MNSRDVIPLVAATKELAHEICDEEGTILRV